MKILHVITSLLTGGAEKLMVDLLPRIKAKGHDVELCSFDSTVTPFRIELEESGITIHSFHQGVQHVYDLRNILRLRRLIIKGGYDIVHTHNTAPQLFVPLATIGLNVMLVTTEHNTTNRRRESLVFKMLDIWMYHRYVNIICISKQAEFNLRKYLHNRENICTIFNGIDYNKYANAIIVNDIRDLGDKLITMIAAFRPQKDQQTLIKAMQFLPETYHLCLVGGGDESRKAMFELLISELNLRKRVHLLGIRNDIPNVLAASDFVVMSSHYEGLSLSNLEGMASGKPFIASDVDGLHEIVNGYGILVEHENAKAFADAIIALDQDGDYKNRIIEQCQTKAKQYDIAIMVDKYLDLYGRLLDGKHL